MGAIEEKPAVAVMFSGGLDSYVALRYAEHLGLRAVPVFVRMGHRYEAKEMKTAWDLLPEGREMVIVDSGWATLTRRHHVDDIIPARNLILATIGALYAPRVWICALEDERLAANADKSTEFFGLTTALLSSIFKLWHREVVVESPFFTMTKAEVIRLALDIGVTREELFATSSCYSEKERKCGKCLTCFKRYEAFLLNQICETGYASNPARSPYAVTLNERMKSEYWWVNITYKRRQEFEEYKSIQWRMPS